MLSPCYTVDCYDNKSCFFLSFVVRNVRSMTTNDKEFYSLLSWECFDYQEDKCVLTTMTRKYKTFIFIRRTNSNVYSYNDATSLDTANK